MIIFIIVLDTVAFICNIAAKLVLFICSITDQIEVELALDLY